MKILRSVTIGVCLMLVLTGCLLQRGTDDDTPEPVEEGLLMHLTFDETLVSEEGIAPTTLPDGTVQYVDGQVGKALYVNSTPWNLNYDVTGILDISEGTIEVWFRPDWSKRDTSQGTSDDDRGIFDWHIMGSNRHHNALRLLMWRRFNTGIHNCKDNDQKSVTSAVPWEAGTWYHITVTWSAAEGYHLYVDGDHVKGSDDYRIPTMSMEDVITLAVGSAQSYKAYSEGLLDEFKLYNYAKTAEEIAEAFQN